MLIRKLQHNINFDPDLHFRPNLDGEKGRRKKQRADEFWNTMRSELQSSLASAALRLPDATIKVPKAIERFKRKAVRIILNGIETFARPDSGSKKDIISLSLAKEHNLKIESAPADREFFSLGNGKTVQSIGRAHVPCSILGDPKSKGKRWFHVLAKLAVPVILGMGWIEKIGLYKEKKHLLVECPSWFGNMPTLKWLGSPQGRIPFTADGEALVGCADTGSDLDLMSLKCARRLGLKIDRSSRTRVLLADGDKCTTEGTVHVSSLELSDFESFETEFHVLDNLASDAVFGEEFLERFDAFNTCADIMDIEDPYLHSLNTLINLGPIQNFLSEMFGSKKREASAQGLGRDSAEEEAVYWRNKAARSYTRVVDDDRIVSQHHPRAGGHRAAADEGLRTTDGRFRTSDDRPPRGVKQRLKDALGKRQAASRTAEA